MPNTTQEFVSTFLRCRKAPGQSVYVMGAGRLGIAIGEWFRQNGLQVTLVDNAIVQSRCGFSVITPSELKEHAEDREISIINSVVDFMEANAQLESCGLSPRQIYSPLPFIEVSALDQSDDAGLKRVIELCRWNTVKTSTGLPHAKSFDVVLTEQCTLKCLDCSNLMQYYTEPRTTELDLVLRSVAAVMAAIPSVFELRLIGGEPLLYKDLVRLVNSLHLRYPSTWLVVYTNGTLKLPHAFETLDLSVRQKLWFEISDYGPLLSKRLNSLEDTLKNIGIGYRTSRIEKWNDCGRMLPSETSEIGAKRFRDCCASDLLTIHRGKLYRCPYSANLTCLTGADERNVSLCSSNDQTDFGTFACAKEAIVEFVSHPIPPNACRTCPGRPRTVPDIVAAVQIRTPRKIGE